MVRGNCQALIYCNYCESIAWSTFEVALLEDYRDTCRVGDDLEEELTELWKSYLVVNFPTRDEDAQILERARCRLCASDVWVLLGFESGVLRVVESVGIYRGTLARANYVSKNVGELFERITGQPFKWQGQPRSDWVGIFSAYRGYSTEYAKQRILRASAAEHDRFQIDGDAGAAWTELMRECVRLQLLDRIGFSDEVVTIAGQQLGPVLALEPDDNIRRYRQLLRRDLLAMRRPQSEWCFVERGQLQALSKSIAVLTRSESQLAKLSLVSGRDLAIVETLAPQRRRALSADGHSALLDGSDESVEVTPEPKGIPLSSAFIPWPTSWCARVGLDLTRWAMNRREGWRTPFGLEDVYVEFPEDGPVLTGVVPGARDHAAPEYLRGEPLLEPGDVFTICALVARVATGQHPFDEGEQGILEERRRPFFGEPRIARIVDRGLQHDPARRGTLTELRDDFMELLRV